MAAQENIAKDSTFTSHLVCQRCTNTLKLSSSLKEELDDEIFTELSRPVYSDTDDRSVLQQIFERKLEISAMRKVMVPAYISDTASDFMVVGELASLPLDSAQSLKITDTLLSLVSDQLSIDEPLCEECTDNILDQMDCQLKITEDELHLYQDFQKNTQKESDDDDDDDLEDLQAQLKELKNEEGILEVQLHDLEAKRNSTKEMLQSHKEAIGELENEKKKHLNTYYKMQHRILLAEDEVCSVNNQIMYAEAQLNKLVNTNAFNATFHIWFSGSYGTINNFRLGRMLKDTVEWSEINAAWGLTVLLLHSLANKMNISFERYKLVPYGDRSYILPLDNESKVLPLYCLGGGIAYVLNPRYDHAMVAFLDCLQQLSVQLKNVYNQYKLPYLIDKGRIIDLLEGGKSYSIKTILNSQDLWTKALKFMLTNLKWALVRVTNNPEMENPIIE